MNAFAKFLSVNRLKRKDIAAFLGVSGAFISQITSGDRPLPDEKLALIKANAYNWNISMLVEPNVSAIESQSANDAFVDYLQQQIKDKDILINELYQKLGVLEAKLDLARKGEIAPIVVGSSDADVV